MSEIEALVRDNVKRLKPYSSARDEFSGGSMILLDANENPFETGVNRYPDPYQSDLKKEIAALKEVDPAQIFLGNGSDEILAMLITVFCEPKHDQIIVCPPTFGMYKVSADVADVETISVPLQSDFNLDVEGILAAANDKTKILFLCSPNNPTGNLMDMGDMLTLLESFKGIVVVDEAYIEFTDTPSFITLLDNYPRLVVTQTFSKAWGLAGIRLGASYSSPEIVGFLNKVKHPYNMNVLSLRAASDALKRKDDVHSKIAELVAARKTLTEKLKEFKCVEKVHASETNFLLVKVSDTNGIYQALLDHGIVVRNISKAHHCENCLRISVGTEQENAKLLKVLADYE